MGMKTTNTNEEQSLACFECALERTLRHLVYDFMLDLVSCPVHGTVFTCEELYRAYYHQVPQ